MTMGKITSLTESNTQRQSILNNHFAVGKMEECLDLSGEKWNSELFFTKTRVAEIFEIDERTVDRYIASHGKELLKNGYNLLKGKKLKEFKTFAHDMNVASKVTQLSIFNFKSLLNLAMLLTESEQAKVIRTRILDIVIDTIASRTGGHTKYINQRDSEYLTSAFQEENYRKEFTNAIKECIKEVNQWMYPKYTNLIYESIFKENASEYKKILKLNRNDSARDTMYAEVLDVISSYETGFAYELKKESKKIGRKLTGEEAELLFKEFAEHPSHKPHINKARTLMASRDLHFREALHHKLEQYVQSVPNGDFEKFLGEKSKSLEEQIKETKDVFKRLKDK